MKRVIFLVAILMLGLVAALPAAAQTGWSLYLYDSASGQVIRVFLDGTQQNVDLGLPPGTYIGRDSIDFTADGNRAAYCPAINAADGAHASLVVRDVGSASTLLNVDLGKTDGCWLKYSEDYSQIAVGVVRHYAGDPNADPNIPAWQLLVLDAASGNQLHETDPIKGAAVFDASRTLMPEVRYFASNQIVFAGLPWGTEGYPMSPAYLWQLGNESVQPIDRWWRWGLDSLSATGELVWTELDPGIHAAEPGGPVPQANVVKLSDQSGQERVIYANPDWVILDTAFIDNGRELAVHELAAFDAAQTSGSQPTRWMAVNRSGATSELATTAGYSEIAAAPDGYVILWASDASASPVLTLEYRSGRETTQLWQQQASGGISWSILWAAPTPTAGDLQPFTAVNP